MCDEAQQQKENEMESLKDLITAQKLLKFEISQTKKAKELAAIEEKIAAIMGPAKSAQRRKPTALVMLKRKKMARSAEHQKASFQSMVRLPTRW